MEGLTSFFEKRNPEYQQAGVMHGTKKRKRNDDKKGYFIKLFEIFLID